MRGITRLAIALLAAASSARADTFCFTITPTTKPGDTYIDYSEKGTLTTSGPSQCGVLTCELITGIWGPGIGTLAPPSDPDDGFVFNDNLLYPTLPGYFDITGILFTEKIKGEMRSIHLYGAGEDDGVAMDDGSHGGVDLVITPASITPEPSSLALFATGLVGMVGVVRRRFA